MNRRKFLRMTLTASASWLAACATRTDGLTPSPPSATNSPTPAPSPTTTPQPTFPPATFARATSSPTRPPAPATLITNVVILIQENHTFDSLFANFPGADGIFAGKACPDALPGDPPHQHADAIKSNSATSDAARCSYSEAMAPNYWKLAREFVLCDRYFSEVRGPSHPNYLMLTAAQSPIINTPLPTDECPAFCLDLPTIADRLDARNLSWRDYGGIFTDIRRMYQRAQVMDRQDAQFFRDAAEGKLPNVAWINSAFLEDGDAASGHPPASLCAGENYAVRVVNALMSSPQWKSSALFLVWDDWGGFYDHVTPPTVESWSDGSAFRYSYRVPCLVVSPYARRGYVSHELHSHVSTLRFIETIFNLPPLNARDANANNLLDCFDFAQAPRPPLTLTPRACPS